MSANHEALRGDHHVRFPMIRLIRVGTVREFGSASAHRVCMVIVHVPHRVKYPAQIRQLSEQSGGLVRFHPCEGACESETSGTSAPIDPLQSSTTEMDYQTVTEHRCPKTFVGQMRWKCILETRERLKNPTQDKS